MRLRETSLFDKIWQEINMTDFVQRWKFFSFTFKLLVYTQVRNAHLSEILLRFDVGYTLRPSLSFQGFDIFQNILREILLHGPFTLEIHHLSVLNVVHIGCALYR